MLFIFEKEKASRIANWFKSDDYESLTGLFLLPISVYREKRDGNG
ncbi:hypothetical protein [Bacillus thuringiensis]